VDVTKQPQQGEVTMAKSKYKKSWQQAQEAEAPRCPELHDFWLREAWRIKGYIQRLKAISEEDWTQFIQDHYRTVKEFGDACEALGGVGEKAELAKACECARRMMAQMENYTGRYAWN
jgi:hypothetical protein